MAIGKTLSIYYDVPNNVIRDPEGWGILKNLYAPSVYYRELVLIQLHLIRLDEDQKGVPYTSLSGVSSFEGVLESDFDQSTPPLIRIPGDKFNQPGHWVGGGQADIAKGEISLVLDADTPQYLERIDKKDSIIGTQLEIQGFDATPRLLTNLRFVFKALNTMNNNRLPVPPPNAQSGQYVAIHVAERISNLEKNLKDGVLKVRSAGGVVFDAIKERTAAELATFSTHKISTGTKNLFHLIKPQVPTKINKISAIVKSNQNVLGKIEVLIRLGNVAGSGTNNSWLANGVAEINGTGVSTIVFNLSAVVELEANNFYYLQFRHKEGDEKSLLYEDFASTELGPYRQGMLYTEENSGEPWVPTKGVLIKVQSPDAVKEAILDYDGLSLIVNGSKVADLATAAADATTKSNTAKTEAIATAKTYTDAEVAKKSNYPSNWKRFRASMSLGDSNVIYDSESPTTSSSVGISIGPEAAGKEFDIYAEVPYWIYNEVAVFEQIPAGSLTRYKFVSLGNAVRTKTILNWSPMDAHFTGVSGPSITWEAWDKTATYIPITTSKKLAHVVTGTQPAGVKTINVNITNMAPSAVLTVRVKGDAARIQYKNAAFTTTLDKIVSNNDVCDFVKIGTELVPLLEISKQVLNKTTTELDAQNLGLGTLAFDTDQYKLKVSYQSNYGKPEGIWLGPGDIANLGGPLGYPLKVGRAYILKNESPIGGILAEISNGANGFLGIATVPGSGLDAGVLASQGSVMVEISETVNVGEYARINPDGTFSGDPAYLPGFSIGIFTNSASFVPGSSTLVPMAILTF